MCSPGTVAMEIPALNMQGTLWCSIVKSRCWRKHQTLNWSIEDLTDALGSLFNEAWIFAVLNSKWGWSNFGLEG